MPISLTSSMRQLPRAHHSAHFLQDLEDHLPFILGHNHFREVGIEPAKALQFAGDFNGLMTDLGHSARLHYVSMRLTGLVSPSDYRADMLSVRIAAADYLTLFTNTWRAHRRQK